MLSPATKQPRENEGEGQKTRVVKEKAVSVGKVEWMKVYMGCRGDDVRLVRPKILRSER